MEATGQHHAPATLQPGNNRVFRWIGGWMSSRGRLERLEKRKITCPCRDWKPGP